MAALAGGKVDLGWVVGERTSQVSADTKAHMEAPMAAEQDVEVLIIHGE
jgi:hypothetical protein